MDDIPNIFVANVRMEDGEEITHQLSLTITDVVLDKTYSRPQARFLHLTLPSAKNLVSYTHHIRYDEESRLHGLFGTSSAAELIGKQVSVMYSNARPLGFQVLPEQYCSNGASK